MAQPAEQKTEIPDNLQDYIDKRIEVDKFKGTIRYVGPVATSKKTTTTWLGIEWDDANRGKNDGSVKTDDGKMHRYFTTQDGKGSFIKPIKANFGRDLLTVILDRFSLDGLEDDLKEQESIAADSAYKIEFVGWDKSIRRQCNLQKKIAVNIEEYDVTHIDMNTLNDLRATVPEAKSLEIRRNLISSIDTFTGLHVLGDTLREINFSHNKLNALNYKTIKSLFDDKNGFNKNTFPNLQCLFLNDTASKVFKPWQFVYMLSINGCLPKLTELQLCCNDINDFKLPSHIINNELEADPNDFGDETESKLCVPSGHKIAEIMPDLENLNIGENPLTDWIEIGDIFGHCRNLSHFQIMYTEMTSILYRKDIFTAMSRLWIRNNLLTDVAVFDELNKFPNLHQLNFIQNSFEDIYGFSTLRDLAIAKIKNLHVCNSSLVNAKERHDAELFYLKWVAKQVALNKEKENNDDDDDDNDDGDDGQNESKNTENDDNDNDNDNGDDAEKLEMKRIDKLYPRYIELTKKHGAMNFDKKVGDKLLAVTVTIKSMDPESITAKPITKKLPTAMTVAQVKMLCKRLFRLNPQYQRLMYREKGSQSFPDDMYDDTKPLSFYNIKDGMEILMQSSNFDKK